MYTIAELTMLEKSDNGAILPGIDTQTGAFISTDAMKGLSAIPLLQAGGFFYVPSKNVVYIKQAGAVINGYDFGSASVIIMANNVTIENCTFEASSGWYAVAQETGYSGAVITHNTFNGEQENLPLEAWITSSPYITISDNTFLNTPADAIHVQDGVVSGNYFSGAAFQAGAHADAIWVSGGGQADSVLISDNFIDWTPTPGAACGPNDAIRITTEQGNTDNVTVTGNYLLGGEFTVDAGNYNAKSQGTFNNIVFSDNYVGFGLYGDFYGGGAAGTSAITETGDVIVDFSNPANSSAAWAAYQTSGIVTNNLVIATGAGNNLNGAATGSTTLYGHGTRESLGGTANETVFVGGYGTQNMSGGSGKNIFSYLSISDSTVNSYDEIANFHASKDVIDLHAIDPNLSSAGIQNFTYIGTAAFSSAGGEVRYEQVNGNTYVEADLVGDSSTDLKIEINGLVTLTAANFALTMGQYDAAIASSTTIATFKTGESWLDQVIGGFSIVDTNANVQSDLSALNADASKIDAVTITDGTLGISVATFAADATVLNKIAAGFNIVDTGASVQADINALEADVGNIKSLTLSGSSAAAPAVLTLSSAQASSDAALLAKITSPYVLDVTTNGVASITGKGNGLTINVGAGNSLVTGGGTSETIALASHFGSATLTDFNQRYTNTSLHDTISLSKTDFANWTTLVSDGHSSGAGNANTTFIAADGASLTVVGVNLHAFQVSGATLQPDFAFHA